jgi:magnesium transporter
MEQQEERTPEVDDLEALVEADDTGALKHFLTLLHPADLAILFTQLDSRHWPRVIAQLPTEELSDLMEELPDHLRDDLAALLKPQQLAEAVEEMTSDDAADVLADLPDSMAQAVLEAIPSQDRHEVETLLAYPEDSAGGLMQMELVSVADSATAEQAVDAIRAKAEDVGELNFVYMVDAARRLTGLLPLKRLILAQPTTRVAEIAERDFFTVQPQTDQEEVARMFQRYDLYSLAVVDAAGRLLGKVMHDDVVDVLHEEHEEDILKAAGAEELELVYTNRVFKIASVRLPWLVGNIFGGLVSGWVLWQFKVSFPEILALLTFVPVIAAMGGNIGSQSSTIVVRGLATGRIDYANLTRFLGRELAISGIMGVVCGLLLGGVALFWHDQWMIGVTVGASLTLGLCASACMGVVIPFLFRIIRVDPAIASGPLVTTINDMLCLTIYYLVALLLLT